MTVDAVVDYGLLTKWFLKNHWSGIPYSHGGMVLKLWGRWYQLRDFYMLDPRDQKMIDLEGQNDARAYENWPRERRLDKPSWCTEAVVAMCKQIIAQDDCEALPILADAIEEGGFDDTKAIATLRTFEQRRDYSLLYVIQVRHLVWRIQNGTN